MRKIGTFEKEQLARRLSLYLEKEGIENNVEVSFDEANHRYSHVVWVHNEDQLEKAESIFEAYQEDPQNPLYDVSLKEVIEEPPFPEQKLAPTARVKMKAYPLTVFLFALCSLIFIMNFFQEQAAQKQQKKSYRILTPVQYYLLFDVPHALIELDKIVLKYNVDPQKDLSKQPPQVQNEIKKIDDMPFWRGIYDAVVDKIKDPSSPFTLSGPLFEKIRQGQVWRLISPCFLHTSFLHILFNVIWLWVLGKQIEERLSIGKFILLLLTVGIVSNVAQYLISGPYFLGYSGIVMGEVGFIWSRQRKAPWEGYPLQKIVFLFLAVYVLAMVFLQSVSFFFDVFKWGVFPIAIANTAHIVGALVGALLGSFSFFSRRPLEP